MALTKTTPARQQYLQIKSQYPDTVLMYQVGDFYETFDEDAVIAARELQIVLTNRAYGQERVPLAGIPLHALDNYVGKLVARGYKVAVCDQVGEAGKGIVDRAVTRILTAGTLSEPNLLPARQNNYLVAIVPGKTCTALAAVDVSAGEFTVTWFAPADLPMALEAELQRLDPVECLLPENLAQDAIHFPVQTITLTRCPGYFFQQEAAQARLCQHFGVQSLEAYGCAHVSQAVAAAGAIILYLEKMNGKLLSLLTGLRSYRASSYMILDAHTQRNLELLHGSRSNSVQGSLLGVLDRTLTAMGSRQLRRTLTQPLLDLSQLDARLQSIEELYESPALRSRFVMCLQSFSDLERIAGRVRQGSAVRNEVLGLCDNLLVVPQLCELLQSCDASLLAELASELETCPQVTDLIGRALLRPDEADDYGDDARMIRPGFHTELDELYASIRDSRRWMVTLEARERQRTGIKSLKVGFNKVFGYYIEITHANTNLVPADYMRKQTLTSAERYITPELKEHEARILSATDRIEEVERSVYSDLLRQIGIYYPELISTASSIAKIDVLLSLAEVAAHQRYVRPQLEQGQRLEIVGGRHPVVEYMLDGDVFIPNDIHLDGEDGECVLLLTGPNMAGKSTYLRQVALITLLAQIGSFVPARQARIGLVDRIFTRVGAEDDIASGKSTFMVEMEETATILNHATRHSLIILDEIGRGTSTYDGLAIARAVVEHLHNQTAARTLFATHYHELAAMDDELKHLGVHTMSISNDEQAGIVFLHRVIPGCAGRSYGVHVARLAGMPLSVVDRAEAVLKQLEDLAASQALPLSNIPHQNGQLAERSNGYYAGNGSSAIQSSEPASHYDWQSEEAQRIARDLATGLADIDQIQLSSITPLDALNLLFFLQRSRRKKQA
jgi:DNA mismatch repair protein MutS